MLAEIKRIPRKALEIYEKYQAVNLPQKIPYLGMGPSYNAVLAMKYAGAKIYPDQASEYLYYQHPREKLPLAMLLSFDEEEQFTTQCRAFFHEYLAIYGHEDHPLAEGSNLLQSYCINANKPSCCSTDYILSLVILYQGLNMDCFRALEFLRKDLDYYEAKGRLLSDAIINFYLNGSRGGIFVLGNGPNIATASQAATIINQTVPLALSGMSLLQFQNIYGLETKHKLIIVINDNGPGKQLSDQYIETLKEIETQCVFIEEIDVPWNLSPLTLIMPFIFAANYLSKKLDLLDVAYT